MVNHQKSEAASRGARMLRTALGPAVARFLENPAIVEVMSTRMGGLSNLPSFSLVFLKRSSVRSRAPREGHQTTA